MQNQADLKWETPLEVSVEKFTGTGAELHAKGSLQENAGKEIVQQAKLRLAVLLREVHGPGVRLYD